MKKWTKIETEVLKENMDTTLSRLKELLPERNEEQIIEKIKLLYRQTTWDRWTDEEEDIIKNNPNKNLFELMKLLPNRTFEAIRYRSYRLNGIFNFKEKTKISWSTEDVQKLRDLKAEGYTNYELAEILGRPLNSILGKLYANCKVKRYTRFERQLWKPSELEYVKLEITKGTTVDDIAKHLERNINTVFQKAIHLGFSSNQIITKSKLGKKNESELRRELNSLSKELKKHSKLIKKNENQLTEQERKYTKIIVKKEIELNALKTKFTRLKKKYNKVVDRV